ncbi:MAG: hypothetical protein WAS21_22125 [Geminicoccaceae bacterium]
MVDRLFGVLVQPWVPWTLATLIVATALAVWLSFRFRRIAPVLAGLDRAIALVEASQGPSGFRRGFKSTYQRLAKDPVVGTVWRAYALTIGVAPGTDEALGYTRRPHESFNDVLLVVAGVNLRLYRAVPNILVGCGLLFTFVGLVGALYFGSQGIGADDIVQAQHALHELLAAATFKFTTSIAGLGSSLVYSWREKALLYRVQYRLARFCAALEERMVPISTVSVVARQLGEIKGQQAELRLHRGQHAAYPPAQMTGPVAEDLDSTVAPLRESLAAAAERLGDLDQWISDAIAQTVPSAKHVEIHRPDMVSVPASKGDGEDIVRTTLWRAWLSATSRRLRTIAPRIGRGKRPGYHVGPITASSSAVANECTGRAAAVIHAEFEAAEHG